MHRVWSMGFRSLVGRTGALAPGDLLQDASRGRHARDCTHRDRLNGE